MPFVLVLAAIGAGPVVPNVCTLVSRNQMATVMAVPVSWVTPQPEEADSGTGAVRVACSYLGAGVAGVVTVLEFATVADALGAWSEAMAVRELGGDDAEAGVAVTAEPGVADAAFWVSAPRSAGYVARRGAFVVSVSVSARDALDAGAIRGQLRDAAAGAAGKL